MICWRLVIVLFAATTWSQTARGIDDWPIKGIVKLEAETGTRLGVFAADAKNQGPLSARSDELFPMCSTFKLLAVAAVLHRVDLGNENLDRFVSYAQSDLLEYAPVTKQHVGEGGMRVDALCEAAIEQSDNTAGNLLLRAIGGPEGLTNFARSIGDKATRLDRMEPDLNDVKPEDPRDSTSPVAMCNDLMKLLTTDFLSSRSRDLLKDWLLKSETGTNLIRAGVPKDWRVGDKTGRSGHGATNDVAVLYPPNGEPLFVAIYVMAPIMSEELRSQVIAQVTREIAKRRPAQKN